MTAMRTSTLLGPAVCVALGCAPVQSQGASPSSISCREPSADSVIRLVQSSEAFSFALATLSDAESKRGSIVDDTQVQRLCASMVKEEPSALTSAELVHAPAVHDIERGFMIFAVHHGRVLLLNPRPDGEFRFGLRLDDWNQFLSSAEQSPTINDDHSAREYGCLLLKYLGNYMPGNPCEAGEAVGLQRTAGGGWKIQFPRFRWSVEFGENGRVVTS